MTLLLHILPRKNQAKHTTKSRQSASRTSEQTETHGRQLEINGDGAADGCGKGWERHRHLGVAAFQSRVQGPAVSKLLTGKPYFLRDSEREVRALAVSPFFAPSAGVTHSHRCFREL